MIFYVVIRLAIIKLLSKYQVDSLAQVQHKEAGCIIFNPQSFHASNLFDISSTEIRKRITQDHALSPTKESKSYHDIFPPDVALYIEEQQLYRD